jgi:MarR family transcriptional regulator, 2-MHQ and catechol-resistance regulon repressor
VQTPPSSSPTPGKLTPKTAAQQPFLPVMRSLAKTYQVFCAHDEQHIRRFGLTVPQFDVIVTLGNTDGMLMNELALRTLVTKGTLTGIVDRLVDKGLVRREVPPNNRRCFRIVLTSEGDKVFQKVFPEHIGYLKTRFDDLSQDDLDEIVAALDKLRKIFPTRL